MDYKVLKPIVFSDGIRDEEIQHNLDTVMQHVSRERLFTAGYGVAHGLEFNVNKNFEITITEGTLVDENGCEIYFPQSTIKVTSPRLTSLIETVQVTANGEIYLSHIPYSVEGLETVQKAFVRENEKNILRPSDILSKLGLQAFDYNNDSKIIPILNISETKITVDSKWRNSFVNIKYSFSGKRHDVIYVNEDDNIKIHEGLTSSSPSVSLPAKKYDPAKTHEENQNSYKTIIGFIEIDAYYGETEALGYATILTKDDLRNVRNIYTDKDNSLYLCGTPFDSIQLIQMEVPSSIKEDMMWYDKLENKLKVCKNNQGILEWATVNDSSYVPAYSFKLWTPSENPADLQTFLFDPDRLDLKFYPGYNSLEIIIDQTPLHSDQFSEVTVKDENGEYVNTGIGFKLASALDNQSYVEVRVRHVVNKNPLPDRMQRSATFIDNGYEIYDSSTKNDLVFITSAPYRYGENQLEVFADGKRLISGLNYIEAPELEEDKRAKGVLTKKFMILSTLSTSTVISYKISNTVYSYDHVHKLVEDLATTIEESKDSVTAGLSTMNQFMSDIGLQIESLGKGIADAQAAINSINSSYVKTSDKLSEENMPLVMLIPKGLINKEYTRTIGVDTINVTSAIAPEDFINVFNITADGGNKIMKPGIDYSVVKNPSTGQVMFNILSGTIPDKSTIYINGIKFK